MNVLLTPIERAYRVVNFVRRGLYRHGILQPKRLPRPVVSIGNIAIGGAGKTPAAITIARYFVSTKRRVAVLTRGYGRVSTEQPLIVSGRDTARFGDEPVLIASKVPEALVVVGADRFRAATEILLEHEIDLFVLDDGFQHLQLHRDVDIVIDHPPARWSREGRSALRDAHMVITRGVAANGYSAKLGITGVVLADRTASREMLEGTKVFAFSALADNTQFFDVLRGAGSHVMGTIGFPDHHVYTDGDLGEIRQQAKESGAELIITTEKDAVKLNAPDIAALAVDLAITPAEQFFSELESRVTQWGAGVSPAVIGRPAR